MAGPSTTRPEKEETEREVEVEEEEPLIDLFGEDDLPPPAEASAPRKHRSGDTWLYQGPGGVDLLTGEEEEGKGKGKEDPFRDVWEDAREREEKRKM